MTRAMDTPFFEDAQGRRRQTSRTTRHAVRSHLHVALLDEEVLDSRLARRAHDVGRKSSPKPKEPPTHPGPRRVQGLEDVLLEAEAQVVGGA